MITHWDWTVIGMYLAFMIAAGLICKHLNRNSSDYFRGGGQMLWWMAGMSTCISSISLWTFSAAGIRVYQTGFYQVAAYFLALAGVPLMYFIFSRRFRRMRVITSADAIRRRYGRSSEQVWVWITLPINLFYSGLGLHLVAIFVGAALGMDIHLTVVVLGTVITVMAVLGGAWAVSVSDFLQGLVTTVVALLICIRVFMLPEVGGPSGFIAQLPAEFTNFNLFSRPLIWAPWLLTMMMNAIFLVMSMDHAGASYLRVKNDRHAQLASLMTAFTPLLPLIVFLPIMASKWIIPDMASVFPNLDQPEEGAYVAIAMKVLPTGMIGMLICAVFAAQMSSLDTGLNKSAGFFVCNFYRDVLRPKASERELLAVGMMFTCLFGVTIITIGWVITSNRNLNIFDFTLLIAPILQLPLVVPMAMGVVTRRTPGWSAWSTLLVGFTVGACVNLAWLSSKSRVEAFADWLGMSTPLTQIEYVDFRQVTAYSLVMFTCFGWYFLTRLFWSKTSDKYKQDVGQFFTDLKLPIGKKNNEEVFLDGPSGSSQQRERDRDQYSIMGWITVAFAGAIFLGTMIPNGWSDRLLFVVAGSIIGGVGGLLLSRRKATS